MNGVGLQRLVANATGEPFELQTRGPGDVMRGWWPVLWFVCFLWSAGAADARPNHPPLEIAAPETEVDAIGDVDGSIPTLQDAPEDTTWIAGWGFDLGSDCSTDGWTEFDNHIRNDGSQYWHIETEFTTAAGISGNSAAVGLHDNVCCVHPDGYDNDWYQGIRMTYTGHATISLDYIVDSEPGFDFLQVETDSLCQSYLRVDYPRYPYFRGASAYRTVVVAADSLKQNGAWRDQTLTDYGPGTHCVYIAFFSDGAFSPCDGDYSTTVGEAAVVDNIVLVDAAGTRTEDFSDGTLDIGTFVNMADTESFGTWGRLYPHIRDNDICHENRTCAWLWTDHITPTLYNDPSMAFGPGGYVVHGWLDDIITSPWVSLASTPTATSTVLSFRRFGGNFFTSSRIVQGWSARGRKDVSGRPCTPHWPGDRWNSLSSFVWQTFVRDLTPFLVSGSEEIQVRFRTSDWQWIANAPPPTPYVPGPGPYLDHVRIGRCILRGPVFAEGTDSRSQAQDCFGSEIDPAVTPAGQHFRPSTDAFAACAFSPGVDLGADARSPNLITGDSIQVQVRGVRQGGATVTSVLWSGAIVAGPHAGKAPPPHTVDSNGFFTIAPDSCRRADGSIVAEWFCIDLDDEYFRGGDVLRYFWSATDDGNGYASLPRGLSAPPSSVTAAEIATRGLFEVDYLPRIDWAPEYLARIAADPHGKLEPTAAERAASTQKNCILYVNNVNARRLSGDAQRTTFMYALDRLGYRETYDVYDHQGMGNTNNQLGGRATVQQCQGYSLIVYDNGNGAAGRPLLPDGSFRLTMKIDQAGWFRSWLAQVPSGEAGFSTLWFLGTNTVQENSSRPLLVEDMGVVKISTDQSMGVNPEIKGVAAFTFDRGTGQASIDFTSERWVLNGGCPSFRDYDGIGASGTAVVTHRYRKSWTGELGPAAVVMNRNDAAGWNTIMTTFPFFDIRDLAGTPALQPPELSFLSRILAAALPLPCLRSPTPTDTGRDELSAPTRTVLHPNAPNPFNPTTEVRFDLAQSGRVSLRIYDVAGKLVQTLVDGEVSAGRDHRVAWNGLDSHDHPVASGVYFYRLETNDAKLTRKLVLMR